MPVVSKRWTVPAVAVAAVAAVGLAPHAFATSAHPTLPPKSAAQLLAAAEQTQVKAVTGTIETTANLGLPSLPDRMTGAASGFAALLTGTHRLRVWGDGPERQRVALLGDLSETDVVHNGRDVWVYDSTTNTVTHWTAPAGSGMRHAGADTGSAAQRLTPQAQADQALRAIDPSTSVRVDPTVRVANRPAYQLVLTPRTQATLVRSVRIAFDAATYAPLRVQVFAAGSKTPAWQTAFTTVSFTAPSASTFTFTPPPGAKVTTRTAAPHAGRLPSAREHMSGTGARPTVVGTGWASIVEFPAGTVDLASVAQPGSGPRDGGSAALLGRVTSTVPQGRLLSTRLLSALVTPDGRLFVGAVPAQALEQAAARSGG